ncbi:MAG: ATP-binding cassette domain-containing protein [Deltaproteobacteria bacterium]|nr:ATP-binding cassette domain-containing protein [Deltaproteobacteria bacterium]
MATDVMIEARDLTKAYGTYRAIDKLNFSIRRGEVVGFLGPNGAGKSTTMRILTCFLAPSSGTAIVGGNDVFEDPLGARSVVGYLPQRAPLYQEMGIVEYLQFVAQLRALPPSEHKARIKKVIEITGLGDQLAKDSIGDLSKGYQQRVGLAQALLHDPPILILDEPTSDLDPIEKAEFIEYIKAIGRDRTVMLSTHNLAEVEASCPRVLIVSKGKLAADGAPNDLANRSGNARYVLEIDGKKRDSKTEVSVDTLTKALKEMSSGLTVKTLPSEDGSIEVQILAPIESGKDLRREIFGLCVDKSWTLLELRREVVQLEEVFRELTVGDQKAGARIEKAGVAKAAAARNAANAEADKDEDSDEDSDEEEKE